MENNDSKQLPENNPKSKARSKSAILIVALFFLLIALTLVFFYFFISKNPPQSVSQQSQPLLDLDYEIEKSTLTPNTFSQYSEPPVSINPQIPTYVINSDLSNVMYTGDLFLSDKAKKLLVKNAFVVKPAYYNEFFPLYESNRYNYTPNFITTDSLLHNYHLMFDFLLKQTEEQKLMIELKKLNTSMLSDAIAFYDIVKGSNWENAAKRNIGFFAVGSKLLDPSVQVPVIVQKEVAEELALIEAHVGIYASKVMNIGTEIGVLIETPQGLQSPDMLKEDYSQYIPRGHYDRSEELKAYFKSMMWYGRLSFRMKNEDEIKSAILITSALNKEVNRESWNKIYEPTNFFVGKSDDISYYEFNNLLNEVYGGTSSLKSLIKDEEKFNIFVEKTKKMEGPKINSIPIFEASISEDRKDEIKAFRFLGQRYTVDAEIFQRLIYREVGDKQTTCADFDPKKTNCQSGARCLPEGLDIPAAIGSIEAKNILSDIGENEYACYSENMSKMNKHISSLGPDIWTQNLYWGWLHQLRPLLEIKTSGYPTFMLNTAWQRKELNTFLGSWSQLKHDTILYAKQSYAELGGMGPKIKDDRGYVEPNPYVYARVAALVKMTSQGLEDRELLSEKMKDNLSRMEQLALSLKTISEKELENKNLSEEEYELIRSYGGQLEHLWIDINKDEKAYKESSNKDDYLNENPAAIIADVATDPNGEVLETGTGKISEIYVVVPIDGKLRIAKGGVYSYYEFTWPMSDRLTDKKWRELLDSEDTPLQPTWTNTFVAN